MNGSLGDILKAARMNVSGASTWVAGDVPDC